MDYIDLITALKISMHDRRSMRLNVRDEEATVTILSVDESNGEVILVQGEQETICYLDQLRLP